MAPLLGPDGKPIQGAPPIQNCPQHSMLPLEYEKITMPDEREIMVLQRAYCPACGMEMHFGSKPNVQPA